MPEKLSGVAAIVAGDKITTDHIMPAGARLKYRSNVQKYAQFVFENVDSGFLKRGLANKAAGAHNIIVAGKSYGPGLQPRVRGHVPDVPGSESCAGQVF